MMGVFSKSAASFQVLVANLGKAASWCLLLLVVVQFSAVVVRYMFAVNFLWLQELALYLHAAIILVGMSWALQKRKHVRIDVLSARFGQTGRRKVDTFGTLFLLLPMMLVIIFSSLGYVQQSWSVFEGSTELSGLPGKFLIKTLIPLFGLLMLGTGVSLLLVRTRK